MISYLIKQILILCIISIIMVLYFPYVLGDPDVDYTHYSNANLGFEISYPSDWEILSFTPPGVFQPKAEVLFGLPNEFVYATVSIEKTNLSLTEYSAYNLNQITENLNSKVFPSQDISISGYPGYKINGIWSDNPFNMVMDVVDTWTVINDFAYSITFYSPRGMQDYGNYPPIIDSVINNMTNSFRLVNN